MRLPGHIDVLLGLQWGDEGKGKLIDMLAPSYKAVVRFQGGPNAGHTIFFNDKKIVLHAVPSGIMSKDVVNIVGPGVVFNPASFVEEMTYCSEIDNSVWDRIKISERAILIHPMYPIMDIARELLRGEGGRIGTTSQGIGPAYAEHRSRDALRVGDIIHDKHEVFEAKYKEITRKILSFFESEERSRKIQILSYVPKGKELTLKELFLRAETQFLSSIEFLRNKKELIIDTTKIIYDLLKNGEDILVEGAQATMLDITHGCYPMVTSSNTISGGVPGALGVPSYTIRKVFGVVKHYTTKVGGGDFPSRMPLDIEKKFQDAGQEFGATTGRPRMCGWLDLVQLKYALFLNGVDELIILKTDICPADNVKIVESYNGMSKDSLYPYDLKTITGAEASSHKAWKIPMGLTQKTKIPKELLAYISYVEKKLDIKVAYIGTGPNRADIIAL